MKSNLELNRKQAGRKAGALAAVMLSLAAWQAGALTVNMATYGVGSITPTVIPPSGLDNTYLVNMVNTYNGGSDQTISGELYHIMQGSLTPNPNLPVPSSLASEVSISGSPTSQGINLGAGGGDYLVAQWDGPEGADAVYWIHGLSGTITLQNTTDFVNANGGAYGLSGYWISSGTPSRDTLPDGGATLILLGSALTALGALKRRFIIK